MMWLYNGFPFKSSVRKPCLNSKKSLNCCILFLYNKNTVNVDMQLSTAAVDNLPDVCGVDGGNDNELVVDDKQNNEKC